MVSLEKWQNFFKNILAYFIFTLCVLVRRVPSTFSFVFDYLPSIDILFLYCYFFMIKKYTAYIHMHLFLLGLIIDTFNFLPLGMNGLSLLLTYKIVDFGVKILFVRDSMLFFLIHNFMFLFFHFILMWFFLSLYQNNFVPITPVFLLIIKNTLYFNSAGFLRRKFIK
jgi:hypothetical protein